MEHALGIEIANGQKMLGGVLRLKKKKKKENSYATISTLAIIKLSLFYNLHSVKRMSE